MDCLLVNAPQYVGRARFQKDQFAGLKIPLEFVEGVSVDLVPESLVRSAARHALRDTSYKDLACLMSHRRAWERVLKKNAFCMICEDDVLMSSRTPQVLQQLERQQLPDLAIFDLEYVPRKHFFAKSGYWQDDSIGQAARILQNKHGLACYVLGPASAERLLAGTEEYRLVDAYVWTRSWPLYLQIEPALAVQMQFCRELPELEIRPVASAKRCVSPTSNLRAQFNVIREKLPQLGSFVTAVTTGEHRLPEINRSEFPYGDHIS